MAVGVAFVDILGDTSRTARQVERDMNGVLAAVNDTIDTVQVAAAVANGTERELTAELNRDIRAVSAAAAQVEVNAALSPDSRRDLQRQLRETAARLRSARSEIEVRVDQRSLVEQTVAAVQVAEAVAPPIEIETNVDSDRVTRSFAGIGQAALGAAGGVGKLTGGVLALGSALQAAAVAVSVLEAIGPAAAVAAPAIVSVGLAIGSVKLATVGVSDAVKAAFDPSDPEAYAEALKGLSPEAAKFVTQLHAMAPALKDIQKGVQDRFFAGLADELKPLSTSVLPALTGGLQDTASSLNLAAKGAADTAVALGDSGTLGRAIHSAIESTRSLVGLPAIGVNAFASLAAAAGPSLEKLAQGAAKAGDSLNAKVNGAFESGALQKAIEQAVSALGTLVSVGSNVVSIFGSIFEAANSQGGSFLDTLNNITGAIAKAFQNPAVIGGLQSLFSTVSLLSTTIGSLLGPALVVVAQALQALAPGAQTLIAALGAGLQPIIAALGPILLAAAQAVTQLVTAFAPLLPVVGLIIAQAGGVLTPILNAMSVVLQQMAPLVAALASALSGFLGPILTQLPVLMTPILSQFVQITGMLFPLAIQLVNQLAPILAQLAGVFVQLTAALLPVITSLINLAIQALGPILPLLPPIIGLVAQLAGLLVGQLASVINNFVVPALKAVAALLQGNFSQAFSFGLDAVKGFAKEMLKIFIRLPYDIVLAIGDVTGTLVKIGVDLIAGLIRGIKSKLTDLGNTLFGVTEFIKEHKGPPDVDARLLTPAGIAIMNSLVTGIQAGRAGLASELASVTSMVGSTSMGLPGVGFGPGAPRSTGAPTSPAFQASPGGAGAGGIGAIQIFVGERELTDIVDVRVARANATQDRRMMTGVRA